MKEVLVSVLFVLINVIGFAHAENDNEISNPEPKGGVITGKVLDDKSNQPMEYSSIAIYSLTDSSLLTGTVSNTEGDFIIKEVPFGEYYLEIQYIGYDKQVLGPVAVSRDKRSFDIGEISLAINTRNIEEVEIVARQKRVEYRIDKKVVNVGEDLNAAGGTAVDVLENTPSVSVDIEGNVTMRGSGSFTVLINGKPTVLEGADALRQIPASTIQSIELITNPSVKYDPDGNAGIINVIMKKQVENGTNGLINASVGLNHKYRLDALINRRIGNASFFIGGGYSDNMYLGSLEREAITFGDTEDHYNTASGGFDFIRGGASLKAGVDYDLSPKSNLTFEVNGGNYSFGMDRTNNSHEFTLPASIDNYFVNTNIMMREGLYYSGNLSFTHNFDSSGQKIVAMANFSRRENNTNEDLKFYTADENYDILTAFIPEETRNVETGDSYEYRYQVDYTLPLGSATLEVGYQGRLDQSIDDYQYQEFDLDTDTWSTIGDNSSEISFYRNIQGAYLQYGGTLGKYQYQLGIRGEYTFRMIEYENFNTSYEINRFDYYPTAHFSRQLEKDQQVMLSYSKRVNRPRGFFLDSIPSYIDKQTVRIGNPGLEPEYVNSVELGYQKGWDKNFLAVEAFYRNTTNKITRVTEYNEEEDLFYRRAMNINEEHVAGSEVMINWQVAKWFNMNASTSGYYNRIVGELFDEDFDNSNFSWSSNFNGTFNYSKTGRIQTTVGYKGPSVTAQGSAEGMFYTNLAVRQDLFKRKLSATLKASDLFGTMKRDFTSYGDGFEQHFVMAHEPRVIMLTLSYKINNYRVDPKEQGRSEGGGMEMDGGF